MSKIITNTFAKMTNKGPTITKIQKNELHVSKPTWWLESRFHFSFADWWQGKQNFGALRVLNDDLVKPQAGFGVHGHRDAEIFSYVVDGELTHQDSMGNKESLGPGGVQYMSAGTGVRHSEMNDHPSETCRFLQIWITPDRPGHRPQYGSLMTSQAQRKNTLLAVLQGTRSPAPEWAVALPGEPIKLHQDATVVVSEADPGVTQEAELKAGRQAYLVCIKGSLQVAATKNASLATELDMREAAEIEAAGESMPLKVAAGPEGAHFMMIELAGR